MLKSDKIGNETIREKLGADKMRKARLRWFEHVKRCADAPVRRSEMLVVGGMSRGISRPKKYWGEAIRQNMTQFHITRT